MQRNVTPEELARMRGRLSKQRAELRRLNKAVAFHKAQATIFARERNYLAKHVQSQQDVMSALEAARDDWHRVADARSVEINRLQALLDDVGSACPVCHGAGVREMGSVELCDNCRGAGRMPESR